MSSIDLFLGSLTIFSVISVSIWCVYIYIYIYVYMVIIPYIYKISILVFFISLLRFPIFPVFLRIFPIACCGIFKKSLPEKYDINVCYFAQCALTEYCGSGGLNNRS